MFSAPTGSAHWTGQRRLSPGKLSFQAHQSAKARDEFTRHFDKHEMLCHDLLLIESWREKVFPRLAARVPEKAVPEGNFVLYHEATVLNMLGRWGSY